MFYKIKKLSNFSYKIKYSQIVTRKHDEKLKLVKIMLKNSEKIEIMLELQKN